MMSPQGYPPCAPGPPVPDGGFGQMMSPPPGSFNTMDQSADFLDMGDVMNTDYQQQPQPGGYGGGGQFFGDSMT